MKTHTLLILAILCGVLLSSCMKAKVPVSSSVLQGHADFCKNLHLNTL